MAADTGKRKRSWFNLFGLLLLAISYSVSLYHQYNVKIESFSDDKTVIRMVHWQLETGVREALDVMARQFEKEYKAETGKDVSIIQIPIGEKAYRQYVTTQCIGGTAPDLIEMGRMDSAQVARFFTPLTPYLFKTNPYNRGTDLEKLAWKDTFFDGLSGSFDALSLEYYGVGFSCFTVRMFYNKRIFKKVLGHDRPPADLDDFVQICKKLKDWAKESKNTSFVPVAGAGYQIGMLRGRFENSVVLEFMLRHDRDFDGMLLGMERLQGYCSESYDFRDPVIQAGQGFFHSLTEYFAPGFMQMGRMEAGFQFSQQNAAFITSGSWDAYSYIQQADFPIGICDFPLPTRKHPTYGHLVKGGLTESGTKTGFNFGLTRFSKHPDVAIRFMQFMTARKRNEEFNRLFKWLPVINGAKTHPVIKAFKPVSEGFWSTDPISIGGDSRMIMEQYLWEYLEHKRTFEEYISQVEKNIPQAQARDYERAMDSIRADIASQSVKTSGYLAQQIFGAGDPKRTEEKLAYVWEARIGRFVEAARWPLEWQELVDKKMPRALKVDKDILNK